MKIKEHGRQINQDLMWMFKLSCITAGAGLILFLLGKMIPLNEDLVDGSFTAFILSCLLSFVLLFFLLVEGGISTLKFFNTSGGVDKLDATGIERMTRVADINAKLGLDAARDEGVAASAGNLHFHVLGMNILFHRNNSLA